MEDIWFNVHRFYQQVSVFLRSKKQSELEVLLECGKKLLCEDIGEEKKQILFSLAGICDIVNDQRALKYWNEIIAASPNDAYFLKALFLKSMFLMRINDKVNGIAIAKQLLEECRLRTNDEYFLLSWEFFGKYYWQEKNYALALEAYSEMFMYAKKNDDKAAQYRALVKTGLIWEKLGRNGLALSNLIKAGVLNLKQPNPIDMIASEYLRGRLLARLGQESMADEVFRKCEIILETAF